MRDGERGVLVLAVVAINRVESAAMSVVLVENMCIFYRLKRKVI